MLFRSRRKPKLVDCKLGTRSPLVLAKLGYDLRAHYVDVLRQPLPNEIEIAIQQLTQGNDPASPDQCRSEERLAGEKVEYFIPTGPDDTEAHG